MLQERSSRIWILTVAMLIAFLVTVPTLGAQRTKIEYWWDNADAVPTSAMRSIVSDFNAYHPSVEVEMMEHSYLTWDKGPNKLKVAIAAGAPPDVVWVDASFMLADAVKDHLYIPLDELMERSFLNAIPYLPAAENYATFNGRHYGLVFRTDSRGLYMNRDLFEESGLDSTRGPVDIAALDALAARLARQDADGSYKQIGFAPNGNNFGNELGWLWVFGGEVFDRALGSLVLSQHPQNLRAVEWITSYAARYGPNAKTSNTNFMAGKVAMQIQSTSWLDRYPTQAPNLNFWVSHIPNPPEGRRTTLSTGTALTVPQGAARPREAGEFLKYLSKPEVQLKWYRLTGELPARGDAIQTLLRGREITDPRERSMVEHMPVAFGYPPLMPLDFFVAISTNFDRMREQKITPQQALEDIERSMGHAFQMSKP